MKQPRPTGENFLGLYLWAALVAASLLFYLAFPEWFSPERLRRFFDANLSASLAAFFMLCVLRAFVLIPLTPLLLAGVLVFPEWPLFLVTLAGILASSALIYWLARRLRMELFFRRHYARQLDRLTALLNKGDLAIIMLWSMAPFTPTDLIVYACSVLRIAVGRTLLGVLAGEALVCAVYIWGGDYLGDRFGWGL